VTNITPIQVILIQTSVVYPRYGINLNIREVEWDNGSLNVTFYVFDEYGQPVDNAMVKMLYDDIERSGTTDVGGLVELKWINTSIESGMMKGNATKAWLQEDYWVDLTLKKCTPCEICNDNGDESNGDSDGDAGNGGIPGFPIGITFVVFCFAIFGLIMTKRKRAFKKPEELFV